jgi:hypothetical protein
MSLLRENLMQMKRFSVLSVIENSIEVPETIEDLERRQH